MRIRQVVATIAVCSIAAACKPTPTGSAPDADAIVVGAGISGLSAAVEMGREGLDVLVLDMNSVPGGHAVMAGGFAIVDTPVQQAAGFQDSAELAFADWMRWTVEGDPDWTRLYAEASREMLYDWVEDMGVEFTRVQGGHENSVPRFHFTQRGALDVVLGLVRTVLDLPTVELSYNKRVERLIVEQGRVTGVEAIDLRSGETTTFSAEHVILATGGFEGDLDRVLANWMPDMPRPDRLLIGASEHATGQGLDLAAEAGAALAGLDRQYIYTNGIVDIHDEQGVFALTAGNDHAVWVNSQGKRFTNEAGFDKQILVDLLDQVPATYWAIFDEAARGEFSMRGAEWIKIPTEGHPVLDNPDIVATAMTLEDLGRDIGIPVDALIETIEGYNAMIDSGADTSFGRFVNPDEAPPGVSQPPFYALQLYPMTRKSMGGVVIDFEGRALAQDSQVVPGLYAVGELTGSVGINGIHGMDGMFLGPAVITGRIAGQTIAAAYADTEKANPAAVIPEDEPTANASPWQATLDAEDLAALLGTERDGYWHFNTSHQMVLDMQFECTLCHSERIPFSAVESRSGRVAQAELCTHCHGR